MNSNRTMSRRFFLQCGAAAGAALAFPVRPARAAAGTTLEKYIQPLPLPNDGIVVAQQRGMNQYAFSQIAIQRRLHPRLPPTPLWAYDDGSGLTGQNGSFGVAIAARSGTPLRVRYRNALPARYPSWIPVDTRLTAGHGDEVRLMTHLHGGFVAAESDGNPAITPDGFGSGETQTVEYPNAQPATLLWFHDHGLGTTRLNVFAGLAAAYILRDEYDTGTEDNPLGLPAGDYELPLVIQDRQFNADGTLRYPTSPIPGATWIGEYFGDIMLVNGLVWPYVDVEPRPYRLRILNGCNARILDLGANGVEFVQIGAEGGLFDAPVPMSHLTLAPAERADVLVDFARFAGKTILLRNSRPQHPVSTPAPALSDVLQFRVGTSVTRQAPTVGDLHGRRAALDRGSVTRFITLNEVAADTPAWHLNLDGAGFMKGGPGQNPRVGAVEDWVFVNLTPDTHPMHTHLFTFQVVGRTPFNVKAYAAAYAGSDGVPGGNDPSRFATGPMEGPAPEERGFKDTVKANPGYYTTIRARIELPPGVSAPQTYVHHCHIVEHEDNDMMERFTVT